MKDLISVIVPIYNVEQYLDECITSIVNQTYTNLEIILINDGSTDRSRIICEKFRLKDKRIIVIDSKNLGGGSAKNIGLNNCKGEYIVFVDSDDYIENNMLEKLYNAMNIYKVDIVQCNIYLLYKNKLRKKREISKSKSLSTEEFLKMTCKDWTYYVIYNKLYKKSLIKEIRFPEGTIIDDEYFTYEVISNAKSIFEIDECMYYYRQRKGSLMHNEDYILRRDENEIEVSKLENEFIERKFPNIIDDFYRKTIDSYLRISYRHFNNKKILNDIVKYLRKNCISSVLRLYSFKEKIWILLFLIFPKQICRYKSRKFEGSELIQDIYFD